MENRGSYKYTYIYMYACVCVKYTGMKEFTLKQLQQKQLFTHLLHVAEHYRSYHNERQWIVCVWLKKKKQAQILPPHGNTKSRPKQY